MRVGDVQSALSRWSHSHSEVAARPPTPDPPLKGEGSLTEKSYAVTAKVVEGGAGLAPRRR